MDTEVDYGLKPCPFCGGEADMWYHGARYGYIVYVKCNVCEAQSRVRGTHKEPKEKDFWNQPACWTVADDWNRRVVVPSAKSEQPKTTGEKQ